MTKSRFEGFVAGNEWWLGLAGLLLFVVVPTCCVVGGINHFRASKAQTNGPLLVQTPVKSSAMNAVAYDRDWRVLEIVFPNGDAYRYIDVPESIYDGLISSPSKGRYFHAKIRGKFDYKRVERKP